MTFFIRIAACVSLGIRSAELVTAILKFAFLAGEGVTATLNLGFFTGEGLSFFRTPAYGRIS